MTPAAGALLRMLGSGVGLIRDAGRVASRPPVEGATFEELLAAAGGVGARPEPVRVDARAGVSLSSDQLERVAEAASSLEEKGASRAVILVDDQALAYDVLTRTITGTVDLASGEAVADIDAVVRAPDAEQEERLRSAQTLRAGNPSLLEILAQRP